jgi:hypothetical protein
MNIAKHFFFTQNFHFMDLEEKGNQFLHISVFIVNTCSPSKNKAHSQAHGGSNFCHLVCCVDLIGKQKHGFTSCLLNDPLLHHSRYLVSLAIWNHAIL